MKGEGRRRRRGPRQTPRTAPGESARLASAPSKGDPWQWTIPLALIPLVLHSMGAPLGEPVAEDFDFLHRAIFPTHWTLFDGGGSQSFWRPGVHQIYYGLLGRLMLSDPLLVALLHVALLGLAAWIFYRALRPAWPGPWAAFAATFPLLAESCRQLVTWPGNFADLAVWLFSAIAAHELSRRRLWTMLAALLAGLLCKEFAILAVLAVPWMPLARPVDLKTRLRWALAAGAVAVGWGIVYLFVRSSSHLALPHGLEAGRTPSWIAIPAHAVWAIANSLRASFSLPSSPTRWDGWIAFLATAMLLAALAAAAMSAKVRARLMAGRLLGAWGLGWFLVGAIALALLFPIWSPSRALYAAMGLGVALAALLGPLGTGALAAFTALRVLAFAVSPGPPPTITMAAPATGAFIDFQSVVRLQRLARHTREALQRRWPTLAPGSVVSHYYLPPYTEYAFGESKALQLWYRDSTLRWVPVKEFEAHPSLPVVTFLEYQPRSHGLSFIAPDAMRNYVAGVDAIVTRRYDEALARLTSADSLQRGSDAVLFPSYVAGELAVCLWEMGRRDEALGEASRSLALFPQNPEALGVVEQARSGSTPSGGR